MPQPLIPRRTFVRDPDRISVSISYDGKRLAWLEPRGGFLNLVVAPADDPSQPRQVTGEAERSLVAEAFWAADNRHLIVFRDPTGAENHQAFSVDADTGTEVALSPAGAKSFVWRLSTRAPSVAVIGCNARDPRRFDPIRVDLATGESTRLLLNETFTDLWLDRDLAVRLGQRWAPDGSATVHSRDADGNWEMVFEIPPEDTLTTRVGWVGADGTTATLLDSRGRDQTAAYEYDLVRRSGRLLAEDAEAEISALLYDPRTLKPAAAAATAARTRWQPIDPTFAPHLERLVALASGGELSFIDTDELFSRLVVYATSSDGPGRYYLYDRASGEARFLFYNRDDLAGLALRPMRSVTVVARDGLRLSCYLTLPEPGFASGPLVLACHGGPYWRDVWGYNGLHQWLADRGYAVLSVNFRGSTGFGKAFLTAADQQWYGAMQEDLEDAVAWAVAEGVADPARLGFFGASYGGYAALAAATKTPELFACIVDVFGISNLVTFMRAIPPYWTSWFGMWKHQLADPETEEGRAWLVAHSPLTHAARIVRPLLIGQGMNDVRVRAEESEQIVRALQSHGTPVTYVTFSDEGHGFTRPENRLAWSAVVEGFLCRHLGGASEPAGNALAGSTLRFEAGEELVGGLAE